METKKMLFKSGNLDLHNQYGSVIQNGNKRYMYLPYWIEVDTLSAFELTGTTEGFIHPLNSIPDNLKRLIKDFRISDEAEKLPLTIMGVDRDILNGTGSWCIMRGNDFIASGSIIEPMTKIKFNARIASIAELFNVDEIAEES